MSGVGIDDIDSGDEEGRLGELIERIVEGESKEDEVGF